MGSLSQPFSRSYSKLFANASSGRLQRALSFNQREIMLPKERNVGKVKNRSQLLGNMLFPCINKGRTAIIHMKHMRPTAAFSRSMTTAEDTNVTKCDEIQFRIGVCFLGGAGVFNASASCIATLLLTFFQVVSHAICLAVCANSSRRLASCNKISTQLTKPSRSSGGIKYPDF